LHYQNEEMPHLVVQLQDIDTEIDYAAWFENLMFPNFRVMFQNGPVLVGHRRRLEAGTGLEH
jgi:hypothetical protein